MSRRDRMRCDNRYLGHSPDRIWPLLRTSWCVTAISSQGSQNGQQRENEQPNKDPRARYKKGRERETGIREDAWWYKIAATRVSVLCKDLALRDLCETAVEEKRIDRWL